ncbi:hypothetical protein PIROE2DRAFT_10226, partial [Piromyces sp. E2]
ICIAINNSISEKCTSSDDIKYICTEIDKTCESAENLCNPKEWTSACIEGYYLTDLTDIDANTKIGTMYHCEDENCYIEESIGYYKGRIGKKEGYFKCDNKNCELIDIEDLDSNCEIGGLIKDEYNYIKFCVDNKIRNSVKFSESNEEYEVIIDAKNSILFNSEDNEYLVLTISDKSIVPKDMSNVPSSNYLVDQYLYNFEKNYNGIVKISKKYDTGVFAFNLDNEQISDSNLNNLSNDDFENINLYHCINGRCKKTEGYIKYQNSFIICQEKCNDILSTDDERYDEIYDIFSNENYKDSQKELLILNKNIAGVSELTSHYYLDFNDGEIELRICRNKGRCDKINTISGYYLYNENENESNVLHYCESKTNCSVKNESDGYFINSSNYDIIKCSNSHCEIIDTESDCTDNNFGVIYKDGKNKFCYKNQDEIFPSDYKTYYELTNVRANIAFPIISNGDDSILVEVDKYSVKQYITNSDEYFCVKNNHQQDIQCSDENSNKYKCPAKLAPCEAEKNDCNPENPTSVCEGYYLKITKSSSNEGTLYKCIKENGKTICNKKEKTRGYYRAQDEKTDVKYIVCDGSRCRGLNEKEDLSEKCQYSGNLIKGDQEYKLCIDNNNSIPFNNIYDQNTNYYLMDNNYNNKKNIFGVKENGSYLLIQITNNEMSLVDNLQSIIF